MQKVQEAVVVPVLTPTEESARRLISFGREICGNLAEAESREWLVTNGLGSYASGTVAGLHTRRYHGLLIAAIQPPLARTLLVAKLDETISYGGEEYPIFANRWADGTVSPEGYKHIEEFRLEGMIPVWRYAIADVQLEKRIWMKQEENTTYVEYRMLRAGLPVRIAMKCFVNYRDHHGETHGGDWQMAVVAMEHGLRITGYEGATPFYLFAKGAEIDPTHDWYCNFDYALERSRGLYDREDHLQAATCSIELEEGETFTFVASTRADPNLDGAVELTARKNHEFVRTKIANRATARKKLPAWIRHLHIAADQFIVDRLLPNDENGKSIIAGYPWFGDWGRDTMISLPGLTLTTRRPEIARSILRTFARYIDKGMLPNRFPEIGGQPEYNTMDATLWYIEAIRQYDEATGDDRTLKELFPALESIIRCHQKGTRYGIHVDPADGLLYGGESGVQLTWMDAKIGDWIVTPRIGKPVEINALWYNALLTMAKFAGRLGAPTEGYQRMAQSAASGFQKFWHAKGGCCYDVIDGPGGNDASLRPNQIFAVSLTASPLTETQQRSIVDVCARNLLTSHGLRTLSPADPRYIGHYGSDQFKRDSEYHQGTVWGWLLGPFVLAHLRVYQDPERARSFLEPMEHHLAAQCIGSMAEIFDGDPPFAPRGCVAQAWTVAEVLRTWNEIAEWQRGSRERT